MQFGAIRVGANDLFEWVSLGYFREQRRTKVPFMSTFSENHLQSPLLIMGRNTRRIVICLQAPTIDCLNMLGENIRGALAAGETNITLLKLM